VCLDWPGGGCEREGCFWGECERGGECEQQWCRGRGDDRLLADVINFRGGKSECNSEIAVRKGIQCETRRGGIEQRNGIG